MGKELLPLQWEARGLLAQLAVIKRMCLVASPLFRKGHGAMGSGKVGVDTGAGVGGRFLSEVSGGSGGEAVGRSGGDWAGSFWSPSFSKGTGGICFAGVG